MNTAPIAWCFFYITIFTYPNLVRPDLPDLTNRRKIHTQAAASPNNASVLSGVSELDDFIALYTPGKIIPSCKSFLVEFSKQAADFIKCSVDNARPFRFCVRCASHYIKAISVYEDIEKNDETQDDCRGLLLVSDRVQIINSVKQSIKDVWTRADCKECFAKLSEDNNGTVTEVLTADAKQFQLLYNNFTNCIPENVTMQQKTPAHNSTVCVECEQYYNALNSLFVKMQLKEDAPRPVCMDMVDMMNYTRLMWGKTLGCTVTHRDIIPVVTITCILLCVPAVFYIGLAVYGTKKQRKLLQEKRLNKFSTSNNYGSIEDSPFLSQTYDVTASTILNDQYTNSVSDRGNLQHSPASTSQGGTTSNRLHNRRLENSIS